MSSLHSTINSLDLSSTEINSEITIISRKPKPVVKITSTTNSSFEISPSVSSSSSLEKQQPYQSHRRASPIASNDSNLSSASTIEDDEVLFDSNMFGIQLDENTVFALHTFVASIEGQASVLKGDKLTLLDDTHSYWWLIKSLKTQEVGYVPADNIESINEKAARLNKLRNVRVAAPTKDDIKLQDASPPHIIAAETNSFNVLDDTSRCVKFSENVDMVEFERIDSDDIEDNDTEIHDSTDIDASTSDERPTIIKKITQWVSAWYYGKTDTSITQVSSPSDGNFDSTPGMDSNGKERKGSTSDKYSRGNSDSEAIEQPSRIRRPLSGLSDQTISDEEARFVDIDDVQGDETGLSTASDVVTKTAPLEENPILVLKIFSGNYDFKATYKTVSVTKKTTVTDVIRLALNKFKVSRDKNEVSDLPPIPDIAYNSLNRENRIKLPAVKTDIESGYYLSVVHGDSKERKLRGTDYILDVLFKLQSKNIIPGIAPGAQKEIMKHMRHVNARGKVSSIRTPNDSEIKLLLNIKQGRDVCTLDPNSTAFIRVYYYGDHFKTGTLRSYKTFAVKGSATISEIIEQTLKKYKIKKEGLHASTNSQPSFRLWKAKEQLLAWTGVGSQTNISTIHNIDPFSASLRGFESIIVPDQLLDEKSSLSEVVRDRFEGNFELTEENMTFVLTDSDDFSDSALGTTASASPTSTDPYKAFMKNSVSDTLLQRQNSNLNDIPNEGQAYLMNLLGATTHESFDSTYSAKKTSGMKKSSTEISSQSVNTVSGSSSKAELIKTEATSPGENVVKEETSTAETNLLQLAMVQ